jgi:hypothetical protein
MRKMLVAVAVVALIAGAVYADQNVKGARKDMTLPQTNPDGGEAQYLLDYFFDGPAGTYTWTGLFYMSNMFKPDPGWYPFGIMTVEVNPAYIDGLGTTGVVGNIDGIAIFTGFGPTVNVAARTLGVPGTVGAWVPYSFTAGNAVVINSGNFWAGIFNSSYMEGGLQGSAINWTGPPVEPFECVDTTVVGSPTAGAAGPWMLHVPGNCGDQYGTTSAATVRVTVDDTVPVELMRFTVE